jgi:hypothetical protein
VGVNAASGAAKLEDHIDAQCSSTARYLSTVQWTSSLGKSPFRSLFFTWSVKEDPLWTWMFNLLSSTSHTVLVFASV